MSHYRAIFTEIVSGTIVGEIPFQNISFTHSLNGAGSASITMPLHPEEDTLTLPPSGAGSSTTITAPQLYTMQNLRPGSTGLYIERGGVIVWAGVIWVANAQVETEKVTFGAEGFLSLLRRRTIREDLTYSNTDQLDIARALVDYAVNTSGSGLAIVNTDTNTSGRLRDRSYLGYERKGVGEALTQLAGVEDGFDFRFDSYWSGTSLETIFRTQYPNQGRKTAHGFELGTNVETLTLDYDGTQLANRVDAIGRAEGDSPLIVTAADPAALASTPLLDVALQLSDVSTSATLLEHANEQLCLVGQPIARVLASGFGNTDPQVGSYIAGDQVRVKASRGWLNVDATYRIVSYTVTVDSSATERVSFELAPLEVFA